MYGQPNTICRRGMHGHGFHMFRFSRLISAIEQNNLELVKKCLGQYRFPGHSFGSNHLSRPFIAAVRNGNIDIIKCFLEHGVQVNAIDSTYSPLLVAINDKCSLEVIKLLVLNGANINNTLDALGDTPLILAIDLNNLPLIEYLISQKVDINKNGRSGHTPLSLAVTSNNFQAVKILVDNGADGNKPNSNGNTALALAKFLQVPEIASYIENNSKHTTYAQLNTIRKRFMSVSKIDIFDQSNSEGSTPLGKAVLSGNLKSIKTLLIAGADTCELGTDGKSPLLLAVQCKNLEAIKLLLDYGAELTIQTAFLEAIITNSLEITKYLLENEVQINLTYRNGCTPLIKSIETNNLEIVKVLVEKGANVNMPDRKGGLPLPTALKGHNLNIAKFLVDKGAKINEKYLEENSDVKTLEILQQLRIDFKNILTNNKHLLLNKAVQANNFPMVKYLIEQGAKVNETHDEEPPLLAVAATKRSFRIIKYLIDAGANIALAAKELEEYADYNEDFAIYLQKMKKLNCGTDDFKYDGHEEAN